MNILELEEATALQLLALGARHLTCICHAGPCNDCPFYRGDDEGNEEGVEPCVSWAFGNPGEALKLCSVDVKYEEAASVEVCKVGTNDGMEQLRRQVEELEKRNRMPTEDLDTERKASSETLRECKAYKKALKWALKHMGV